MFLLVGGPLFVFSGRAYVDSSIAFASNVSDLQSTIKLNFAVYYFFLAKF